MKLCIQREKLNVREYIRIIVLIYVYIYTTILYLTVILSHIHLYMHIKPYSYASILHALVRYDVHRQENELNFSN